MKSGNALFQKNQRLVYFTLRRYFPQLLGDKDAAQIALITLWKASENYKPHLARFSTYAVQAMRRSLSDYYRKEKKYHEKTLFYDDNRENETLENYDNSFSAVLAVEDEDLNNVEYEIDLEEFLKTLTAEEKSVYQLLLDGFSQTEIADKLLMTRYKVTFTIKTIGDKWLEREERN